MLPNCPTRRPAGAGSLGSGPVHTPRRSNRRQDDRKEPVLTSQLAPTAYGWNVSVQSIYEQKFTVKDGKGKCAGRASCATTDAGAWLKETNRQLSGEIDAEEL